MIEIDDSNPRRPPIVIVTQPETKAAKAKDTEEPRNPYIVYQDPYDEMKPLLDAINESLPDVRNEVLKALALPSCSRPCFPEIPVNNCAP